MSNNITYTSDKVDSPDHYLPGTYEVINIIEAHECDFLIGNVLKYCLRAGKKNPDREIEDLEKAKWYLDRKLKLLKKKRREAAEKDMETYK